MTQFKARVYVQLKPSVLDPQGKAIEHALSALGFSAAKNVRVGKYFDLEVNADSKEAAEKRLGEMAHTLLANPVIENFSVSLDMN
ncbi:MAG: phosphoribosylformylglycinamidine synthase subunit PurS [Candidatus Omnitrophica bacterium]|nr:phosphoribosylformylglycinamidine synthase subunit PurS [Candidatus Omnitrophota bacterium]